MESDKRLNPYFYARHLMEIKRPDEAFEEYEKLALAGDPACQVYVGWMLSEGIGVEKDVERAFGWFERAASLGSKEGMFYYGAYAQKFGNYDLGLKWFQQAAEQDYGPALLWLGIAYIRGLGVEVDLEKGLKYLRCSDITGNLFARREIALLKLRGKCGLLQIPLGALSLVPLAVIWVVEAFRNPDSYRFRA